MKRPVFGIIDCNNFFVSCERIFQPDLEGKPVVVLSSNDGCAVARSDEAKALGIPMAAPAFKYRDVFERHKVVAFSANFELYGDISRRITALLASITPRLEVYSIDESFLDLSELPIEDYTAWARIVRERLLRWVGVPVSIGIAPTKTLAKLASDRAKKQPDLGGVLNLVDIPSENITLHLEATAIESVWGIGRRLGPRLRAEGISNAWQLASTRPQYAQALMGIHGRHLTAELNGLSCFPLEREDKSRKSIARTRTFGEDMNDIYSLEAAIATFAATAAYRLRESGQVTQRAGLFLTTSRHKPGYRSWSREVTFDPATADTGQLIHALVTILQELHQPQARYHRAGIWLHDFLPADQLQTDLLGRVDVVAHDRATQRMQAIDDINGRFGRRMLRYATEDLGTRWQPRHSSRSPRYVSAWNELPQVRIVA
jgi:DNA polymerase V